MQETFAVLFAVCSCAAATPAQEAVRQLEGPGRHTKYLTPNQLDCWLFEGEKDETIIAHVATTEFDSILELAVKGAKEGKVLLQRG